MANIKYLFALLIDSLDSEDVHVRDMVSLEPGMAEFNGPTEVVLVVQ